MALEPVHINNVGTFGIVQDLRGHELPPEAWTDGNNVRFHANKVLKVKGYQPVWGTLNNAPYAAFQVRVPGNVYWVYPGLAACGVYSSSDVAHADITRTVGGAYSANQNTPWTGDVIGGILVLNNFNDVPQYWATPGIANKLADLPNWPSGYNARAMVAYKQFLIALGVDQGATDAPHRVLWSDQADPGSIPGSWDIADATTLAGQTDLSDTESGGIMNGMRLGDVLMIYKEKSIWAMYPSNNILIFNFDQLKEGVGIASQNGVAQVPQRQEHLLFTGNDLVKWNGQDVESVIDSKTRDKLVSLLDTTYYARSFMITHSRRNEIWLCFPSLNNQWPDKALIVNYKTGANSWRDLPPTPFIATGIVDSGSTTGGTLWDNLNATWDSQDIIWGDDVSSGKLGNTLLMCDAENSKLHQMEYSETNENANMTAYVERLGLTVIGYDRTGQPKEDHRSRKLFNRLWPKAKGGQITIRGAAQEEIDGPVRYTAPAYFDPSVDKFVDFDEPISGRFLGVRFESNLDTTWELEGYAIEMDLLGEF